MLFKHSEKDKDRNVIFRHLRVALSALLLQFSPIFFSLNLQVLTTLFRVSMHLSSLFSGLNTFSIHAATLMLSWFEIICVQITGTDRCIGWPILSADIGPYQINRIGIWVISMHKYENGFKAGKNAWTSDLK